MVHPESAMRILLLLRAPTEPQVQGAVAAVQALEGSSQLSSLRVPAALPGSWLALEPIGGGECQLQKDAAPLIGKM